MLKEIKKFRDLPFEEGKTYRTKFQTGEMFMITKINKRYFKSVNYESEIITGFEGIYLSHPHIGVCPLAVDRLIPEKIEDGVEQVCGHCGKLV